MTWDTFLVLYLLYSYKMEAQFSPGVKEVIQFSREEAIRLGHSYIGTEHFLLGLIRQGDGKAISVLFLWHHL